MSAKSIIDPKLWRNPPVEYRPVPFWSLNEKLEAEELKRQIREMKAHGFGGFFIHARLGLKTTYLSEEWFSIVQLCTEEAERLGMRAWIYDEDRWPSGFAGGQIDRLETDYAAKGLICRTDNGNRKFEVIRSPKNAVTNNAHDPSSLDPEVTAEFLKLTHERYRDAVGEHFGKAIPGTFTDEPSYVMWGHADKFNCVPWTDRMEEFFRSARGYDLTPHLAKLFFEEGNYRQIRVDFYRTVTELFSTSFVKQLYDWSEKHDLISTGHLMMEDSLLSQVRAIGAAMPHYECFHQPGIDHLGNLMPHAPLLQKQCSSVARQLGKQRVLSEIFGACGWETPVWQLKPAGDYDFALGINFLNQHLAYYSICGRRKRDYPPSCSYHLSGYELYRPFNDYFSRLSYALSQGRNQCKMLVLHPISSAWALYSPLAPEPVEELDRDFAELCHNLLKIQRDYDFGDELLMEKYARINNGQFIIGEAAYDAVIVPSSENWSSNTLRLLCDFAAQGGKIIMIGDLPQFIDGCQTQKFESFMTGSAVTRLEQATPVALRQTLASVSNDVTVTESGGDLIEELIYQHRTDGVRELYFLTFGHRTKPFLARIALEGEGQVTLFDANTGGIKEISALAQDGKMVFELNVPERGSLLLLLDRSSHPRTCQTVIPEIQETVLDGNWEISRLDPNVLVIERCRVKFYNSPWSEPMGIAGGGGAVSLPNAHDLLDSTFERKYLPPEWPVYLRFEFRAEFPCSQEPDMALVIENPVMLTDFKINGQEVPVSSDDYWLDRQFRKVRLGNAVRSGLNRIDCRVHWVPPTVPGTLRFTPDGTELENVYLIGDFDVGLSGKNPRIIPSQALPTVPASDLTRHGLPFYAGTLRYEKHFTLAEKLSNRRYIVKFPRPCGDGLRLSVNGKAAGLLWSEPFTADCTELLHSGDNVIQVELFANLGNLLGNVHHQKPWSDPAHFKAAYQVQPLGLGGDVKLITCQ